ncbi:MAG: hypothetical protein ACREQI_10010 [Candidatus Binataceae bacterium]
MNLKRWLTGFGTVALLLAMALPAAAQVDLGQYTAQGSIEAGAWSRAGRRTIRR